MPDDGHLTWPQFIRLNRPGRGVYWQRPVPAKRKRLVMPTRATGVEGPGLEVYRLDNYHALMLPRTRGIRALQDQPQSHEANRSGEPAAAAG